jgi:exodeoxyribonuclease V gamma subunit
VLGAPPPAVDTVLSVLQRELAAGAPGSAPLPQSPHDASIRVHSAHGEMRQLEIIRDQLLDALQSDPTLRPHDLLVLVPDAAAWAPLVDAVFGVNEPGAPRIPYRIADRPARGDDPAAGAFSELLALQGGRFTHSEVFALLSHPLVHDAAGLSEAQVDALATLTHRANARWGYDAHSRASLGLPAYEAATWRESLDRLLVGMTTGPQGDLVLDVLPQSGDTVGDAAGIGRLAQWIDEVAVAIASWQTARSLDAWVTAMEEAVTLLFGTPELRNAEAVSSVTRLLDRLRAQAVQAHYAPTVSFGVVRDWIDTELEADSFGSGFLTGGMTIAALKPMRSLPFRIIAVAGLDEGVFPRRDRRAAFDMLDVEPRAGDRDLRSDDRQLFLDLMLAAGDRLVLAYSGRAVSDNSPCAASVVVDELLDHLDRRSGGAARATLLVEHPLQPFSPRYFQPGGDPRLFTYSTAHARTAAASHQPRGGDLAFVTAPIEPAARDRAPTFELTIAELADCWCNASRYFCRQALGFTLTTFEDEAGDDEVLELSHMEQGGVRARLLTSGLRGDLAPARDLRRMQGEGAVPPGVLGAIWNTRLRESVDAVLAALPAHAPRQLSVTVTAADWRVHGTLDGIRGEARYIARAGSFRASHEIRAWVEHVVMCAAAEQGGADIPQQTVLLGYEKEKAKVSDRFGMVTDATSVLTALVAAARRGREEPLVFFPQAAVAWLAAHRSNVKFLAGDKRIKGMKDPRFLATAAFEARGEFGAPGGDDTDAHVALCFRGVDPLRDRWDDFERLVTMLFAPRLAGAST